MKKLLLASALLSTFALAACGDNGYYDSDGRYVPSHRSDVHKNTATANSQVERVEREYSDVYGEDGLTRTTTVTTYSFDRPGYYDYDGNYLETLAALKVPRSMFPARGKCRIWFADRPANRQPAVESCDAIRMRVPEGAYVVYGG